MQKNDNYRVDKHSKCTSAELSVAPAADERRGGENSGRPRVLELSHPRFEMPTGSLVRGVAGGGKGVWGVSVCTV